MKFSNWAMGLISQLVTWITRKRNLGLVLVSITSTVFIALAGGGFSIELQGVAGIISAFKFSTGGGLPGHLQSLLVYLLGVTWVVGVGMLVSSYLREHREADVNRVVVVEMRGLVDTSDRPLINAIPAALVGRRIDSLVNVRSLLTGPAPNVPEALKEIEHIRRDVRMGRGDTAREHVKVAAGGVMQVALLFYAGTLLDDEGKVVIVDWDRTAGHWRELNEPDDGSRFTINGLDDVVSATDVVVAVSASYKAALDDIEVTFPGLPLVHLARANPEPNTLWSEETQAALTQQFLQTLATLANRGVKTVHLVLAAPASLSIRFGMAYDHRNMPNLLCYQRERDHVPPYPWSVQMPTAVQPVRYLHTPKPAVVIA
jgi:hypothetical protein